MAPATRSILAFGLTGGLSTVVYAGLSIALQRWSGLGDLGSNTLAYVAGFFVSYFGHRHFTFRSRLDIRQSMPRFLVIALAGLVLSQLVLMAVTCGCGLPYASGVVAVVLTVTPMTYLLGRIWAFHDGDF